MQSSSPIPAAPARPVLGGLTEDSLSGMAKRKALMGYLFLAPTILGILVFTAGPVLASFGLSFYSWNVFKPPVFLGIDNYQRLFTDGRALNGFYNTIRFVVMAVSLQITLALLLALALQRRMAKPLRYFFRSAYFLPLLMSGAAVSISLAYLFHTEFGVINYYLGLVGLPRISWLTSASVAMYTIVLTSVWHHVGFTFIIFVGGLGNISPEILDAADVDGAEGFNRLWHVILPMLSPTLLFAFVVGIIGALQVFEEPYIMTRGGPGDATRTAVLVMYEAAFKNIEIGYGSAITVILFLVIMAVTAFQFWLSKRWVFYQ
jgi:multiple sugar transport system permease protein